MWGGVAEVTAYRCAAVKSRANTKVTATHLRTQGQDGVLYQFTCRLARKVATCKHRVG